MTTLFYQFTDLCSKVKLINSSKTSVEKIKENINFKGPKVKSYSDYETKQNIKNEATIMNIKVCSIVIRLNHLCPGIDCRSVLPPTKSNKYIALFKMQSIT